MHWEKQGLLLPAPLPVPWATSHAALPIAHPSEEGRLRVYYSARDERSRARIGAADVALGGKFEHLPGPLLDVGALGAFDDSGVTGGCVVEVEGRRYLYYTGWSLGVTVPFYYSIGCAISEGGNARFERVSAARDGQDGRRSLSCGIAVDPHRERCVAHVVRLLCSLGV